MALLAIGVTVVIQVRDSARREGELQASLKFQAVIQQANGLGLDIAGNVGKPGGWAGSPDPNQALIDNLGHIKDEMSSFRGALGQCVNGAPATPTAVAQDWVARACVPVVDLIPSYVTKVAPIDGDDTQGKAKIAPDGKGAYSLELARTTARGSFSGACWEFNAQPNLLHSRQLEVGLTSDAAGFYEFKFELPDARQGQSNVQTQIPRIGPSTVTVDLSKVSETVRQKLARFCIAIAQDAVGSPERARLTVAYAKAR